MLHREEQELKVIRESLQAARSRLAPGSAVLVATTELLSAGEVMTLGRWVFATEGPREEGVEVRLVEGGDNTRAPLRCILPAEAVATELAVFEVGAPAFIRKSVLGHGRLGIIRSVASAGRKPVEVEIYDEWLADGTTARLPRDGLVPLARRPGQ